MMCVFVFSLYCVMLFLQSAPILTFSSHHAGLSLIDKLARQFHFSHLLSSPPISRILAPSPSSSLFFFLFILGHAGVPFNIIPLSSPCCSY
eukprot:m.25034 g.25034  ORF g.25034 m.25034 type:complete len:91 (-) comp8816_c0_seq2:50-322(-)